MKRDFYNPAESKTAFLWSVFLPQVASILMVLFFSLFFKTADEMSSSIIYILACAMLSQGCFFITYWYVNKKNKIDFIPASKLAGEFNIKNVVICVLISVIAIFGLQNFVNLISIAFEKIGLKNDGIGLPLTNIKWLIVNIILLAVIPAFAEEFLFRGIIFNGYKKHGLWLSAVVSSAMFAIVHLSVHQLVFPFIMGMVFSLIVHKTGSLKYSIITHFSNNFLVVAISYISSKTGANFGVISNFNVPTILLSILLAIITLLVIYYLLKKLKNTSKQENDLLVSVPLTQEGKSNMFTPLIIGACFWFLMIILSVI